MEPSKLATVIGVMELPADVYVIYLSDGTRLIVDAPELTDVLRDRPRIMLVHEHPEP